MPGTYFSADRGPDCKPQLLAVASSLAFPSQGCYTVILNTFETYVYLAGAFAIGVLAIEVSGGAWGGGSPRVCMLSLLPRSTAAAYFKCLLLESFL